MTALSLMLKKSGFNTGLWQRWQTYEVDCQTKAFEYKQEPTNPAFPTQVEYLEIGDVTHSILVEPMRRYSGLNSSTRRLTYC